MLTHLLLDFFGTLVEYSDSRTEQGYARSHSILLAHGATLQYAAFLERWSVICEAFEAEAQSSQDEYSMDSVVTCFLTNIFGAGFPPEMTPNFRDTYLQEWNQGVKYIAGVPSLLRQLSSQYTLVLVTNTHHSDLVQAHLSNLQIRDCFTRVVTSIEHGKRKPHPSIFQHALHVTGGESDHALYVGDSFTSDYLGSKGMGMRCLLIDPHKKQNVPDEDRIAHILDLSRMLNMG